MSQYDGYSKRELTAAIRATQTDIPKFEKAGLPARAEQLRTALADLKDELRTR